VALQREFRDEILEPGIEDCLQLSSVEGIGFCFVCYGLRQGALYNEVTPLREFAHLRRRRLLLLPGPLLFSRIVQVYATFVEHLRVFSQTPDRCR
jgi:hypothetical protein